MKKGLVPALHHHRLIDDLTPSMRWDGVTDLYEWQKQAKEKLYAAKKEGKKVYFRSQTKGKK